MSVIDALLAKYSRVVRLPWPRGVTGAERTWILVYPPRDERRLRAKIDEFEIATRQANHDWECVDLTDGFAHWMASLEYREDYFEHPEDMSLLLAAFGDYLEASVVHRPAVHESDTVIALVGLASLFGVYSVSALLERIGDKVGGRVLAFFPGVRMGSNYRLLDAKDGWNYLAIPIDLTEDDQ